MQQVAGERGRAAQRRRTRKAIVEAASGLIARGITPSIAEVAEAADVSRRTIYMYFPTLDQLLVDATLGALHEAAVESVLEPAELEDDVEARVDALARAIVRERDAETERLGRTLIRLTVESPGENGPLAAPRRGYRRVEWIERALAPLRGRLDDARFERLVSALAMVVGWEAMLVLRDLRGLDRPDEENVSSWAARALVRAALDELDQEMSRQGDDG
jgi:AcrR family transcriptional regulator